MMKYSRKYNPELLKESVPTRIDKYDRKPFADYNNDPRTSYKANSNYEKLDLSTTYQPRPYNIETKYEPRQPYSYKANNLDFNTNATSKEPSYENDKPIQRRYSRKAYEQTPKYAELKTKQDFDKLGKESNNKSIPSMRPERSTSSYIPTYNRQNIKTYEGNFNNDVLKNLDKVQEKIKNLLKR